MDYAGVIKLALGVGVLCLLLFLLSWLYKKGKAIGYQKGYVDAQDKSQKQVAKSYSDIADGSMPDGMHESNKTWRVPSIKGSGVESDTGDGSGK